MSENIIVSHPKHPGRFTVSTSEIEAALDIKPGSYKCDDLNAKALLNSCCYLKRLGVDLRDEAAVRTAFPHTPGYTAAYVDALVIAARGFSTNF